MKTIDWDESTKKFKIAVSLVGTEETREYEADYCVCNLAMPFLSRILSDKLLNIPGMGLDNDFKNALQAVFTAQFEPMKAPVSHLEKMVMFQNSWLIRPKLAGKLTDIYGKEVL